MSSPDGSSADTIQVTAKVTNYYGTVPVAGAVVVFADGDGTTRALTTGTDGTVTGNLSADGTVWHDRSIAGPLFGADYQVYADLQDGDTVGFGAIVEGQTVFTASMTIVPNPPQDPGGTLRAAVSSCGEGPNAFAIGFDADCGSTTDLFLTDDVMYAYLTAIPIVDGGTITVDPSAWKPLEAVSVTTTPGVSPIAIANAFHELTFLPEHDGKLGLVGSHLFVGMRAQQGTDIVVKTPVQASQTIDAAPLLLPAVTVVDDAWSGDGSGDMTGAWLVTHYRWGLPAPNGTSIVDVHVFSPTAEPGPIPDLVPWAADERFAPIDRQIERTVKLVRLDVDRATILANLDQLGFVGSDLGYGHLDLPGMSLSSNGPP